MLEINDEMCPYYIFNGVLYNEDVQDNIQLMYIKVCSKFIMFGKIETNS